MTPRIFSLLTLVQFASHEIAESPDFVPLLNSEERLFRLWKSRYQLGPFILKHIDIALLADFSLCYGDSIPLQRPCGFKIGCETGVPTHSKFRDRFHEKAGDSVIEGAGTLLFHIAFGRKFAYPVIIREVEVKISNDLFVLAAERFPATTNSLEQGTVRNNSCFVFREWEKWDDSLDTTSDLKTNLADDIVAQFGTKILEWCLVEKIVPRLLELLNKS